MVIKKRQILWDWTNSAGAGNPGVPDKINQVPFGNSSPVASVVNWNAWVPPELKDRAPFRPMVRVLQSASGNDWAMIENTKYPIILFFNEPERAGISPEQARDIWNKQMLPLRKNKGKKLGSPAVASDDNGRKWIEKFMSLVAHNPPDFLCLHYYSKNGGDAIKYIQDMHNKWPQHKVMVTEIACIDRNAQAVVNFTVQVCNWMDGQDWVFEYGLFDFQRKVADNFISPAAQLMDANGNFTELGKMYVHQQPMKAPGKAEVHAAEIATVGPVSHEPSDAVFHAAEVASNGEFSVAAALSPDQQNALNIHNNKRKAKGLKPLIWDNQLAKNAEAYAKHLAQIGKLEHSSGDQRPNQGENLAAASGSNTPLAMAANMWLDEEKNYHGEPIGQGNFGSYGHYTQCMWRSTTKLGMASAKDAKGSVYIVGRYSPPGNVVGQKPY
ncbi:glycoside hydrolase family 128 protein [Hypoxylon trugodes]|uniref:glycoside hydrolase family 128 protein n=1 Tax=Hypoxylon trugodes TaxID=326681 RepID=UPI00218CFD48|nr:glycoside hydrolase family 128 protein [Hypoxylon trugodes]KAI1387875.1 glycoside hydrolase family 128 protein [Hypoxylon trugodes]